MATALKANKSFLHSVQKFNPNYRATILLISYFKVSNVKTCFPKLLTLFSRNSFKPPLSSFKNAISGMWGGEGVHGPFQSSSLVSKPCVKQFFYFLIVLNLCLIPVFVYLQTAVDDFEECLNKI